MLLLPGESSNATDASDAAVIRVAPEMHQNECSYDPTAAVFRVFISSSDSLSQIIDYSVDYEQIYTHAAW